MAAVMLLADASLSLSLSLSRVMLLTDASLFSGKEVVVVLAQACLCFR